MPRQKPADDQQDEGTAQLDQMRAAVADEVADLLSRLPADAGLLEITMAEGADPAALARYLADLPDTDDLTTLAATLNDPEALVRLLATCDRPDTDEPGSAQADWPRGDLAGTTATKANRGRRQQTEPRGVQSASQRTRGFMERRYREESTMLKHREVADWLDERQERFITISDTIWEYAEVALAETKSCRLQAGDLEADGFRITRDVGGLPTAFIAEWGESGPAIGFLGEYDALPELSQKSQAAQEPLVPGGAGHGCGHNLLGTASLAAASALKAWLQATGRPGTVRYYGCPAEETGAGKVFMARGGAFEGLDAALTWHPGGHTSVMLGSSLAIDHVTFRFFGQTAHAAGAPEMGRSALDAVELTNIGVNYLREHVIDSARIHYVITNGGGQPNVVPAEAEVWYYIRAPRRDLLDPITQRVLKIAEAAAMMTETRLEVHDFYGVHNYLPNVTLGKVAIDVLGELGPIEFTAEEEAYAMEISNAFGETARLRALERAGLPKEMANRALIGEPHPPSDEGKTMSGSTDVSEASWNAPTLQLWSTCFALGAPGHSWAITATGQMSIGHKGMMHAAKAMAISAAQLFDDPDLLARAKDEFGQATDGYEYRAAIPDGAEPPQPHIRA